MSCGTFGRPRQQRKLSASARRQLDWWFPALTTRDLRRLRRSGQFGMDDYFNKYLQ